MRLRSAISRLMPFDAALLAFAVGLAWLAIESTRPRTPAEALLAQAACRQARQMVALADGIQDLVRANPQIAEIAEEFGKANLRREMAYALIRDQCPEYARAAGGSARQALR